MNIKQAKDYIKDCVKIYLKKDEFGEYRIPVVRQRPIFLLGAPGIGKTAVMEQIAQLLPRWQEEGWQVVVTADHGMDRFGIHGGPTEEQRTIPLYIFSAAAVPGRFQEEEISQLNLAPLLCRLLGLPPAPGMREGLEVKLTDL